MLRNGMKAVTNARKTVVKRRATASGTRFAMITVARSVTRSTPENETRTLKQFMRCIHTHKKSKGVQRNKPQFFLWIQCCATNQRRW